VIRLRRRTFITLLTLLLFALALPTWADIEVIQLQHRTAAELIPILRPAVGEGTALSGDGFRLIVRGTPAEIDEVRSTVRRLDQRQDDLRISLRRHTGRSAAASGIEGSGEIRAGTGQNSAGARVKVYSTKDSDAGTQHQSVRAVEGKPTFIDTGSSVPVRSRIVGRDRGGGYVGESTRYRGTPDGFYATARVSGDNRVNVEISVVSESWRGQGQPIQHRRVLTTVSGRLNQWIPLAGVESSRSGNGGGLTRSTHSESDRFEALEIRVQRIGG
jgi:hypothetical protein